MSIFICSLNQFSEDYLMICANQECFKKEYSTACADSLLVINKLFSLLMVKRKQMYWMFIDFAKAFDSVKTLHGNEINIKMYT